MTLKSLSSSFCFTENCEDTHTWTLTEHLVSESPLDVLAALLAEKIVEQQCINVPRYYEAWKRCFHEKIPIDSKTKTALMAFLKPVFGDPSDTNSVTKDHLEGYVGEMLWFFLCRENPSEEIVHIDPPSFKVTEQGGDGFIIHRLRSKSLLFRLWEMKKYVPGPSNTSSSVSGTVSNAYSQLNERALEYLARYTAIGQRYQDDAEISMFCSQIVDLWLACSPQAAAGVSVVTSRNQIPRTVFSTFGQRFPGFTNPIRLRGMLTATENFDDFAKKVREYVWKGL